MIDVGNSAKRDTRRIDLAERRRKLLLLRRQGASYEECARALGLHDRAHAQKEFVAALDAITQGEAEHYRKMAEMRFDSYLFAMRNKIRNGDTQAIAEARKIEKTTTQKLEGGNTAEFYAHEGTTPKSAMQVKLHPDVSKMVFRFGRVHHYVDYGPFKRNKMLRKAAVLPDGKNEYGMVLKQHG